MAHLLSKKIICEHRYNLDPYLKLWLMLDRQANADSRFSYVCANWKSIEFLFTLTFLFVVWTTVPFRRPMDGQLSILYYSLLQCNSDRFVLGGLNSCSVFKI